MNGRQELGLEVGEMSHRYLKPTKVFKDAEMLLHPVYLRGIALLEIEGG